MSELILTRGIPASGKSTWAKAWVAEDREHRFRVNRDNLRWTFGIKTGRGTFEEEQEVTYWQREMVKHALTAGKSVVVDDTNLTAKFVKEWLRLAAEYGVPVKFQDFPISLEVAYVRDLNRTNAVGPDVIENFYKRFTPKGKMPPVPVLDNAQAPVKFKPYVPQEGLPFAILVDIDGTLAHMNGRSPYDPTLYHTDSFDHIVAAVAESYATDMRSWMIVMSGRDETHRAETEQWLAKHNFKYDMLYMRPAGDNRNDAIVKDELFEKHIAGKFNVDFVLDDRDRVVKMWRAKGLKVLQVADGNF